MTCRENMLPRRGPFMARVWGRSGCDGRFPSAVGGRRVGRRLEGGVCSRAGRDGAGRDGTGISAQGHCWKGRVRLRMRS